MSDELRRSLIEDCQGMSEEEIIATYHTEFFDEEQPHVRAAFEEMGIDEHEVTQWVQRNIK